MTAFLFVRPALAVALAASLMAAHPASAEDALEGMDVVNLRDSGRATPGGEAITTHWRGSEWHFANEANRAAFEGDPRAYAPGFGGNCPVALSEGERRAGRPELFVVVGRTLYLTSSPDARATLKAGPDPILKAAKAAWQKLAR